jgi:hypothetical protein
MEVRFCNVNASWHNVQRALMEMFQSLWSQIVFSVGLLPDHARRCVKSGYCDYDYISRVRDFTAPMHLGLLAGPLCPISSQGSPETLPKLQMAPQAYNLNILRLQEKEPRYACLSEVTAPYSQRIWAEVSSVTPHFLHTGLANSPIR